MHIRCFCVAGGIGRDPNFLWSNSFFLACFAMFRRNNTYASRGRVSTLFPRAAAPRKWSAKGAARKRISTTKKPAFRKASYKAVKPVYVRKPLGTHRREPGFRRHHAVAWHSMHRELMHVNRGYRERFPRRGISAAEFARNMAFSYPYLYPERLRARAEKLLADEIRFRSTDRPRLRDPFPRVVDPHHDPDYISGHGRSPCASSPCCLPPACSPPCPSWQR